MILDRQRDAILLGALFTANSEGVPRQQLAVKAGMAAGNLETALAPYVQIGYPIAFHPQGSISLNDPPDIWCAEEIVGRCMVPEHASASAWEPLLLAETASTNDVARERGRRGARSGFVVGAGRQTAGRGRLGRNWESPPDRGLYVSILLRPELAMTETGRLPVLGSVAAVDAVEALCGVRPGIKWPNDVVLGGRKLAGLLIETEPKGGRLDYAVVGIGVNVRHAAEDFSPGVREIATSLYLATGQLYRRADLLVALLRALEGRMSRPFAEAREAWTSSSLTLGQQVRLTTVRGRKHGQAMGLDETGALLLRTDSGEVEAITAGDMQAA